MSKKTCLECGTVLYGRSDKKFCDDNCRSTYHNHSDKDIRNYVKGINYILRKNRRILNKLDNLGNESADRLSLLRMGFNFSYYTNIYELQNGYRYYFIYDLGYRKLNEEQYQLIRKEMLI